MHRLADEVVDGGRRQRREEVAKEARVVCAPYKRWGLSATQRGPHRGPGPQRAAHSRVSCAQPSGRRSATPACSCPHIQTARYPPSRTAGCGRGSWSSPRSFVSLDRSSRSCPPSEAYQRWRCKARKGTRTERTP
eukprot:scaffold881_cov65-Phaeocystis_antarctica.AAC.1